MITSRGALVAALKTYSTAFPAEENTVKEFLRLLEHPCCFQRDHLPGHLTGSAWVINHERSKVLLVHHAKLRRWLQPGGHADGDEDILRVALRELGEETGLKNFVLAIPSLFDIDIHTIPQRTDFPEHLHYDVRFLIEADEQEPLTIDHESTGIRWVRPSDLPDLTGHHPSLLRMAGKAFLAG
jgi:8-oxo-dGTP pyrophosphatase MutT (NUDIX family)